MKETNEPKTMTKTTNRQKPQERQNHKKDKTKKLNIIQKKIDLDYKGQQG